MDNVAINEQVKQYRPLAISAGLGSMLGSGIIVSLSATLGVWQQGLHLTNTQIGMLSGILTFAIGFGSLFGGRIAESIGLTRTFNATNLFYAIGTLLCIFSNSYYLLLAGVAVIGLISGTDLPVSLSIVSRNAPNKEVSARLVSFTQVFWQVGIFMSYICAFLVSRMHGIMGARVVFVVLCSLALITWIWRTFSKTFKKFNEDGEKKALDSTDDVSETAETKSVIKVLFDKKNKQFLYIFIAIFVYYASWNLMANTWGQFQTFMLTKSGATQAIATGAGFLLSILGFIVSVIFSKLSSGRGRLFCFYSGAVITFIAMLGMMTGGSNLTIILGSMTLFNIGACLCGEALYKVWTQESFPVNVRSSIQGVINGTSRILCALFAIITPALVMPGMISKTMFAFALNVILFTIAGMIVMRLQKKYK